MKKIVLLFLMLPLLAFSQGQKLAVVSISKLAADADVFVGFDKFGYSYFIKDNVFIKTNGKDELEYKKIANGKIVRADIENPLLIVLFYESFNTIVLLDNQLNEVKEINFTALDIPVVAHAAGIASQNRIWIYDSLTQQIGFYDYLKNTYQSITTPFKENLKYYQSDFNDFMWIDTKSAWYACDIFGKVYALGEIGDFDRIQLASDHAYFYSKNGKLYFHDTAKQTVYEITGIDKSFKKFYCKDQILAIFTTGGITNYKIILP